MASLNRRSAGQAVQAELALLSSLKNCLLNLPASLVAVLVNSNTIAQNVVVELTYRQPKPPNSGSDSPTGSTQRSVFAGWTGMQSKPRTAPLVGRDGLNATRGGNHDVAVVEMDATFGRLLGFTDGQKVGVLLHVDPPQAHTINIDPLTPADWEMIELHAQFLELNFLSQVRALPNPSFAPSPDGARQAPHPITLHLSPTSTANVSVAKLSPAPPSTSAFVKISPDAEVIVAPRTRQRAERAGREGGSVASAGRRSASGRSGASTVRRRSGREDDRRRPIFLRGVDRGIVQEWFDFDEVSQDDGLKIWVDRDILLNKAFRGLQHVYVSVVKLAGLQEATDPQKEADQEKPTSKIVATLLPWNDAPDGHHVALSTTLTKSLACENMVGGLVRLEPASTSARITKTPPPKDPKDGTAKSFALKIHPFGSGSSQLATGLKFGGESRQERQEAADRVAAMFGKNASRNKLLEGPVTDGMILPATSDTDPTWHGAIVKFDPPAQSNDSSKNSPAWFLGSEKKFSLDVQPEIAKPTLALKGWSAGEALPEEPAVMVGVDPMIEQLMSHLSHSSSVLLNGGLGSGKTSMAHLIAQRLRNEYLFHVVYYPTRTLVTDNTSVSTIKETMNRLFASAMWGARLGGRSIIILDDLDRLCPVETELQVGGENGRSRQVSEILCSVVRQYCTRDSGVVLLATAQSKEALNNVVIGGHVVREIVNLKAPTKEGRRQVLEALVQQEKKPEAKQPQRDMTSSGTDDSKANHSWHRSTDSQNSRFSADSSQLPGFCVDPAIDFLDLAGQTDGYMPGDLVLLVSRARSEALIRAVTSPSASSMISISKDDFTNALRGFTPASLRNVSLQSSTTRWDSIGGLHSTRQTLLETLQYPTTYAPIFAHCPLRLRSGLLLYGFPGCGKTLLASAVAGECGLNFISVKGPEILNKYIGASEKSVRDLFERAEAARPCVLFFDEFDSIAPKRGHDSTGVTDRVVNQLLTQMDGAEGLSGVYVLAATSRPDLIDPALLRPGRLDKSLLCDMPTFSDRVDIIRALGRRIHFGEDIVGDGDNEDGLQEIARLTEGYSGADLQAVVYNAQLEAIHDVLGDNDTDFSAKGGKGGRGSTDRTKRPASSKGLPEFTYFRMGNPDPLQPDSPAPSSNLTERAMIAAKIQAMQAIRRKQKQMQHQQRHQLDARRQRQRSYSNYSMDSYQPDQEEEDGDEDQGKGSSEPVIEWRHVVKSLEETRASISPQERRRLEGIYREFVVGRNGEMPSGQGGSEIGGRTSLM